MTTYRGSCLCGGIRYEIAQALSDFGYCYCRSCQKASGTAFGANAGVERSKVSLSDNHRYLKEFESSPGKFRAFCSHCGSPLYAYHQASKDLIRIRLGSLDTTFDKTCKAHTFISEKAPWHSFEGSVPQFATWADPNVLVLVGSKQSL